MVAAEIVGFRFEADLFKSAPMILCFGCHEQHWDVSPQEDGCSRSRWFRIRSRPLQMSTDDPRLWLSWTTLKCLTTTKRLLQKPLVSDLKQTFKSVRSFIGFGCHLDVSLYENGCRRNRWFQIRGRPFQISTDAPRLWLPLTTLRFSRWENGCSRIRWIRIRSRPLQISTYAPRLLLSWTTVRRFTIREWLLQKPLVWDSKQTSSNQYRWC